MEGFILRVTSANHKSYRKFFSIIFWLSSLKRKKEGERVKVYLLSFPNLIMAGNSSEQSRELPTRQRGN